MADKTKIAWCDATWNPITGCTPVSEGCDHCYARRMAGRNLPNIHGGPFSTLKIHIDRIDWTLKKRTPSRIFVGSMTDMFHPQVEPIWLASVFNVMASATLQKCRCKVHDPECWAGPQHTFLMLTKRPENIHGHLTAAKTAIDEHLHPESCAAASFDAGLTLPWPNVWMGVTAENQERYDERVLPLYQSCKGNRRWVSLEPLLGPICLRLDKYPIHWVVVGCETGPGRRPCPNGWVYDVVDQCRDAGVPVFVKQVWSDAKGHNAVVEDPHKFYSLFASSVDDVRQFPVW